MWIDTDIATTSASVTANPSPSTLPPWLSVHRNTVWRGWLDTLAHQFSAVARLVGEDAFEGLARAYLERHKPRSPVMHDFGSELPTFIGQFEPANDWPWLADVAQLDWWWSRAHGAADATPLDANAFAQLWAQPEQTVAIHPSAHWGWFASGPVLALWAANRWPEQPEYAWQANTPWIAQGGLVARPHLEVKAHPLSPGAVVFLDHCHNGETVAQALHAALQAEPALPLVEMSRSFWSLGVFTAPATLGDTDHD